MLATEQTSSYVRFITDGDDGRQWLRDATALPPLRQRRRTVAQSPNRLLSILPQNIFAAIQPHLRDIELVFADVVAEPDEQVNRVYFPHTGVISLVIEMESGSMIETAMVGRDGVANATSALDGKMSFHKGIVQVAGTASVISSDALRSIADEFGPFRSMLIRHEQVLLAEAQQSAGCNAGHTVEARMCRWLLRIRDLTQSDEMELTQEFLSQMLGVRRTSVSLVANTLQKAGFIKYRRGHIEIVDAEKLQSGTCECYEKVKARYATLVMREV
jgi:CRP-like cAMP-binding protein